MIKEFETVFDRLGGETIELFIALDALILECTEKPLTEKLWSKAPMYYIDDGKPFFPFKNCERSRAVHVLPFKGHITIYANALSLEESRNELSEYRFTPKGMLQIYCGQPLKKDALKKVFKKSLEINL